MDERTKPSRCRSIGVVWAKAMQWTRCMAVLAGFAAVLQPIAWASPEQLANDLARGSQEMRVAARQGLPRYGASAVPAVMPLLAHEDLVVSKAAYEILWGIANAVSQPGRDEERREVVEHLYRLIAPDRNDAIRMKGLRLLAISVPKGTSVKPIAAMLQDPSLGDQARTTLERIDTEKSAAALVDSLDNAPAELKCSILASLGTMRRPETVEAVVRHTRDQDPMVRAAAASALSWTGNPSHAKTLRSVWQNATPDTLFEATDALLRLADAIAAKGGNWQHAVNLYHDVLNNTPSDVLAGAAMVGLGNCGDEAVIGPALAALDETPALVPVASLVLTNLEGASAARALAAAYPDRTIETQVLLMNVFGQRGDPALLQRVAAASRSEDPTLQVAALRALGDGGWVEGIDILMETAHGDAGEEERQIALGAAEQLAGVLRERGDPAVGRVYLAILESTDDADLRRRMLEGIADHPVAEAFPVVLEASSNTAFADVAAKALLGVAGALVASGQNDKALEAYEAASLLRPTGGDLTEIMTQMQRLGAGEGVAQQLGFVTDWWIVGPFEWDDGAGWDRTYVGEPDVDLAAQHRSGETDVSWRRHVVQDPTGKLDLRAAVADRDYCVAYAYTELEVPQDTEAVLRLGVDDGEKVWVNGELAFENRINRPLQVDQDRVPVHLKKGRNRLLLKISQNNMGWEFCLRATTPDGFVLPLADHAEEAGP